VTNALRESRYSLPQALQQLCLASFKSTAKVIWQGDIAQLIIKYAKDILSKSSTSMRLEVGPGCQ